MSPSKSTLQFIAFVCWVLLFPAVQAQAQSGVAVVAADATVYEDEPDDNGGAYGEICAGNHDLTDTRRGFVRFTLPAIPDGAVITRVVYDFTQLRARGNCPTCPKTANLELRRVLEDWVEGLGGANNAACGGGTPVAGVDWNGAPAVQTGVSATEFMPSGPNSPITRKPLSKLDPSYYGKIMIGGIYRNDAWQVAVGDTHIQSEERVIVVCGSPPLKDVQKLFLA